jgi:hypothetical protein
MNKQAVVQTPSAFSSTVTPITSGLLQRACACGKHSHGEGECEECRKKREALSPRTAITSAELSGRPASDQPARFGTEHAGHDFSQVPVHFASSKSKGKAEPSDREGAGIPSAEAERTPEAEEGDTGGASASAAEEEEPSQAVEPARASAEAPAAESTELPSSKEKIEFEVIHEDLPAESEATGKAKCPAPRNAPINFSTRRSTAAQIAAMSACTWGITSPDPLRVSTLTCRDGADWRLRVTGVKSVIRTFSRQLAGQREPTVGNSTAANFCAQVTELDSLGSCAGSWYMLAAVRAHEQVHVDEWRTSMGSDWPAQKAIIEGLSVPASGATKSRGAATRAMRSSAAFTNALQTDNASGNYPAFWGIPDPNAQTNAAERVIVTPRIRQLCVHARNKGWGPGACPVCAGLGIT